MKINKLLIIFLLFLLFIVIVEAQSMVYYQQPPAVAQQQSLNEEPPAAIEEETGTFTIIEPARVINLQEDRLRLDCRHEPSGLVVGGIFVPGPVLPSLPYDLENGDCEMLGNEERISQYIKTLVDIAEDCKNSAIEKYPEVLDDKETLDDEIDNLPPPSEDVGLVPVLPIRGLGSDFGSIDLDERYFDDNYAYTNLLKSIKEATLGVCEQRDRVSEVLFEKCDDINYDLRYYEKYYQGVPDSAKESFHRRLSYVPSISERAKNESIRRFNEWLMLVVNNFNESIDYEAISQRCGEGRLVAVKNFPRRHDLEFFIKAEIRKEGKRFLISSSVPSKYVELTGNLTLESEEEVSLSNGSLDVSSGDKKLSVKFSPESALDLAVSNGTLEVENVKLFVIKNRLAYQVRTTFRMKLFGFIPIKVKEKTVVDAETLTVLSKRKSFWTLFARED